MQNKQCPVCASQGHDKNGDHLYLMSDGKTWCCMRTQYHPDGKIFLEDEGGEGRSADRTGVKGETFKSTVLKGREVDPMSFPVKGFRDIPDHIYGNAGVRCDVDEFEEPVAFYYPLYTLNGEMLWKIRKLPKDFFTSEKVEDRQLMFFNQDKVGIPKKLLITEGQDDCLAAIHMLSKYHVKCVSVPNGANIKAFVDNFNWLTQIEELYFDPDTDAAGNKLLAQVVELFPLVKILKKSKKDACDMYKHKLKDEYVDAFFRALPYKPDCIKEITDDLIEEACKPVEWGLSYPFDVLTEKTFGFVFPCVIGIGGGPGSGKTTFTQAIQSHFVYHHKMPIGIIDLENKPGFALRKLIGYQLGVKIHTPDTPYPPEMQEEAKSIGQDLRKRGVIFYDSDGDIEWEDVMSAIRYMVVTKGIKAIFIDPLSGLVAHLSASEGNEYLNKALFQLSRLTRELNFGVFHVNHLNNPSTDKDHGEGAIVRGSQFAGSRAMWKFSTDLWGIEVNQQATDIEERLKATVRIIKHRLDGRTGTFPLRYNPETGKHEGINANSLFSATRKKPPGVQERNERPSDVVFGGEGTPTPPIEKPTDQGPPDVRPDNQQKKTIGKIVRKNKTIGDFL